MVSDTEDCGEVESPVTKARRVTVVPLAGKTMLDEPRDFPFTIRLPAGACPTILTRYRAHRTGLTPTAHR